MKRQGSDGSDGARAVWWIVALPALAFAADAVGAAIARLLEGRASADVAFSVALVASVGLCFVFPLALDWRITRAYRRLDADARATPVQTLALVDGVILALLVILLPRFMRASLESHGAWFMRSAGGAPTSFAERTTDWLARHIPRSELAAAPIADAGAPSDAADASSGSAAEVTPRVDASAAEGPGGRDPQSVFQTRADTVVVISAAQGIDPKDVSSALFSQLGLKTMRSFGSGFLVAADGRIVTCHHVIDRADL